MAITHPDLSIFHTQPGVVLTEMNLSAGTPTASRMLIFKRHINL